MKQKNSLLSDLSIWGQFLIFWNYSIWIIALIFNIEFVWTKMGREQNWHQKVNFFQFQIPYEESHSRNLFYYWWWCLLLQIIRSFLISIIKSLWAERFQDVDSPTTQFVRKDFESSLIFSIVFHLYDLNLMDCASKIAIETASSVDSKYDISVAEDSLIWGLSAPLRSRIWRQPSSLLCGGSLRPRGRVCGCRWLPGVSVSARSPRRPEHGLHCRGRELWGELGLRLSAGLRGLQVCGPLYCSAQALWSGCRLHSPEPRGSLPVSRGNHWGPLHKLQHLSHSLWSSQRWRLLLVFQPGSEERPDVSRRCSLSWRDRSGAVQCLVMWCRTNIM